MQAKRFSVIIIIFLFLSSLNFFSYVNLDSILFGRVSKVYLALFFIFILLKWGSIKALSLQFPSKNYVVLFLVLPVITVFTCLFQHGQSISSSLSVMFPHLVLCVYFYLILNRIDKEIIVKILILFALIRTGLTAIEQLTYPNVMFAFRMDRYNEYGIFVPLEIRSGFYRFLISDAYYLPMFAGFYTFSKLLEKVRVKYLLVFLFCCFGLYMDQTRQIMFSFIACLLFLPFLRKSSYIFKYIFFITIIGSILYVYADVLFGETLLKTKSEVNDDNIRVLSYTYYFTNTGPLLTTLFGNGFAGDSIFGKEINKLENFGLFRSDIGVVGAIHLLGYIFVIVFVFYYINVVRKNWKYIDTPLQLMLISILCNLPLIFPLYNFTLSGIEFFMGVLFYLTDKSILENKAKIK